MLSTKSEQIAEIYKTHRRKMLNTCMKYTKDRDEAEDFLHDGILKAMEKAEMIDLTKNPESYIMRIIVNNMLDRHRSAKKYEVVSMDDVDCTNMFHDVICNYEEDERERSDNMKKVNNELDLISDRDRKIFKMHVLEGRKHYEIADMLDINYNTVRCTYVRVRNRLTDNLKK